MTLTSSTRTNLFPAPPWLRWCCCALLTLICLAGDGPARAQTPPTSPDPADSGQRIPGMAERVAACTACHGSQGRAGPDGYYPRIAGKPETYLLHQLRNFRDGRRRYPPMNYLLAHLSDDYLLQMARYFADQHPPYPPPAQANTPRSVLERGQSLVTQGAPERRIPACAACHGAALSGVQPAIPGLLGLPRDYISAQLGAWRNGTRHARTPDCMAEVAQALTPDDINAVSSWLALQAPPATPPASAPPAPLPASCGSMAGAAP